MSINYPLGIHCVSRFNAMESVSHNVMLTVYCSASKGMFQVFFIGFPSRKFVFCT